MNTQDSALRLLAKNYANDLLTRSQYVMVRAQLLNKLQNKGNIDRTDLNNFMLISQGRAQPENSNSYSLSDWIIIALGIGASIALGYVLYS